MSLFASLLREKLAGAVSLTESQIAELEQHYELLVRWNRRMNLTSIRKPEGIVERHYCESLLLGSRFPAGSHSIADIGSGAGFPGLPVAALRPECSVSLVESHSRKCVFLRESSRRLPNVQVLERRAEDLDIGFDWLVSRAVGAERIVKVAEKLAANVGLLTSESEAGELASRSCSFAWRDVEPLPWGDRRVVLIGHVSRGTPGRP